MLASLSAINSSLLFWEGVEYTFAALVVVACLGEYVGEFTKWAKRNDDKAHLLRKCSTLLLVIALALEVLGMVRTNQISNIEIAELDLARMKLEAIIANRHLTPEQQQAIAESLSTYAGRVVWLRSNVGDPEAKRVALEIKAALELARITVEDRTEQPLGGAQVLGLLVCGEGPADSAFAEAVIESLKTDAKLIVRPFNRLGCTGETSINVGLKPLGP